MVDGIFTNLSLGRPFTLTGPDELTIPIANLGNLVMPRAGYYSRRCPPLWPLVSREGRPSIHLLQADLHESRKQIASGDVPTN